MSTRVRGFIFSFMLLVVGSVPQIAFGVWDIDAIGTRSAAFGVSTLTFTAIFKNIINYALAILGFLGVLGFIVAGIMYLLSAGDETAAKTAKGYMINSIIGVTVALLGYVVMAAISTLLGAGGATQGL